MKVESEHHWLPLYIDHELDVETSRAFEKHLDACQECQARLAEMEALRTTIRAQALRHTAPTPLRQRIARAATTSRNHFTDWRSYALAASWAMAFVLGGLITGILPRATHSSSDPTLLTHDLLAGHLRALAAASPVDVISTDRHTVKPWFAGKTALTPVVQDFADEGYALVGGRVDYIGVARVPVLVYRHGQHLADVFVLPEGGRPAASQLQGYAIDMLNLGGQPAAIVSDLGDIERRRLCQLLENAH